MRKAGWWVVGAWVGSGGLRIGDGGGGCPPNGSAVYGVFDDYMLVGDLKWLMVGEHGVLYKVHMV